MVVIRGYPAVRLPPLPTTYTPLFPSTGTGTTSGRYITGTLHLCGLSLRELHI